MEENTKDNKIFYILLFFAIVLCGFLCKWLSSVILPVVFSIMISFVLLPVVRKINLKIGIPWVISSVIVVILFSIIFISIFSLLIRSLSIIVSEYPKYETKFMTLYQLLANNLDLEIDENKSFIGNIWKYLKVRDLIQKAAVFLSSGIVTFGKNLFLVVIMSTFLLIEMRLTKRKMHYAFSKNREKVTRISHQIVTETVRYVSIKFLISLATGILSFLVSCILKIDFPIVWGFLAFIMNFIPIFGSIFAVGLTTLFTILQSYPNWSTPLIILVSLTAINMILGNILEPRIEGNNLGISPFAILVCLSFWGYIWGFVGMIIAVPMTVIIKIVCENIDYLNGIATFIGNNPKRK